MEKVDKMRIFLLLIVFIMFSCKEKKNKEQSNYQFYIEEIDTYITTSKHLEGKFYVIFKNNDSLGVVSPNTDYVGFETGHTSINIIFDLSNKCNIYILDEFNTVKFINQNHYKIKKVNNCEYNSLFFEPRSTTEPLRIKPTYINLDIESMQYSISLKNRIVKKSDIYGGW